MSYLQAIVLALASAIATAGAAEIVPYDDRNVYCAHLAYNSGYEEQGNYYRALVKPYWVTRKFDVDFVDKQTTDALWKASKARDVTITAVARGFYNLECNP